MKILILGASGTVGSAIYKRLSAVYGVYDVCGTYCNHKPADISDVDKERLYKYDIADPTALDNILHDVAPDLIISSLTGNFEHQFNAHKRVAEYLEGSGGRCIFISTANVFDGSPDIRHIKSDTPYPVSEYGRYKYSCEQLLQNSLGNRTLIIRLPKILTSREAIEEIQYYENGHPVFENLYRSYNTPGNVAETIQFCIGADKSGIVHLTSDDFVSMDGFVKSLLAKYKRDIAYKADLLTVENYANMLGCDNPSLIRQSRDGNFYLSLKNTDPDLSARFGLSCEDVVASLNVGLNIGGNGN